MNELNPIEIQTMTSREIAELTKKNHKDVMRDCRKLISEYEKLYENQSAQICALIKPGTYKDKNGDNQPCFLLNRQASLDLVTGYSLPHRHAVNKRWMELEESARIAGSANLPDFTNPAEAAIAWAEQWKLREAEKRRADAVTAELSAAQPAIQFHEEVSQSHGELTIREVWQILLNGERGGERRLRDWLRRNRWLTPGTGKVSAYALQRGLMRVRLDPGADGRLWPTPVVTGYGLTMLRHLYRTGELFTVGIDKSRLLAPGVAQ
jgi:phage regulator Rha-like protein